MGMNMILRRFDPVEAPATPGREAARFAHGFGHGADQRVLDMIQLWHPCNYLASGAVWADALPENWLLGGTHWHAMHPDEEPPRVLSPQEVRAIRTHLDSLDEALLDERMQYMASGRTGTYRAPTSREERAWTRDEYDRLTDFFRAAAEADEAILKTVG